MSFLEDVSPDDLKSPFDNPFLKKRPRPTVYRWLITGDLKGIRMGRKWFTTDKWVNEYLVASTNNSVNSRTISNNGEQGNRVAEVEAAEKKWKSILGKKSDNEKSKGIN